MNAFDKGSRNIMGLATTLYVVYIVGILAACGFIAWVTFVLLSHFGVI